MLDKNLENELTRYILKI